MLGWLTPMLSTYDISYVFTLVNTVYTNATGKEDTGNAGLPGVPTKLRELVVLRPRRALNTKGVETVSNCTRQLRFSLEGKSMPVDGWEGFRDVNTSVEESGIGHKPSVPLYSR
jgi:hypothetical protein